MPVFDLMLQFIDRYKMGNHHTEHEFPGILEKETIPGTKFRFSEKCYNYRPDDANGDTCGYKNEIRSTFFEPGQQMENQIKLDYSGNKPEMSTIGASDRAIKHFVEKYMSSQGVPGRFKYGNELRNQS